MEKNDINSENNNVLDAKKIHKTLDDKDFFSAYLNMARHNAYIALSYFSNLLGSKSANEENLKGMQVIDILKNNQKDTIKVQKSIKLLTKNFKFLPALIYSENKATINEINNSDEEPILTEQQLKDAAIAIKYYTVLEIFFEQFNSLRNYYSHHGKQPLQIQNRIIEFLNKIFDSSVRIIKQRFKLEEKDILHLRRYAGSEKDSNGKRLPKDNPNFFFKILNENNELNEKGLSFFICLFLEKKYANDFLKKIKGFKNARTTDKQATFEVYTALRINIPKQKIQSDETNIGFALDMLNELKRCPNELYDLLSKENQDKFRIPIEKTKEEDDYDENGLLKRFRDRFPEFALKYFDYKENFPIKFQVNMGKYYFKFYEKQLVNGEIEIRKLDKNLLTYGNPIKLNEKRINDENWKKFLASNPNNIENFDFENSKAIDYSPFIQDKYPNYHIENNTIAIKFVKTDNLPQIKHEDTKNEKPDAVISIYELPGMIFYDWLNRNETKEVASDLLFAYYNKVIQLFKDISSNKLTPIVYHFSDSNDKNIKTKELKEAKEIVNSTIKVKYNIDINDLPEVIQRHLIGKSLLKKEAFKTYAFDKLNKMMYETESRIKKIIKLLQSFKDKTNKPGSKRFKDLRTGVLADFLAKDMLRFQPSLNEGKDKITALNFQVLQSNLALYGTNRTELNSIFKDCKLINSANSHPFLHKINPEKYSNFIGFYKTYLIERKYYLQKCIDEKKYETYSFLKPNRNKWGIEKQTDFVQYITNKYLNQHPINFPRGLFSDALRDYFKNTNEPELIPLKNLVINSEKVNTVYLIQKYFELIRHDNPQDFYSFVRSYKFINQLFDNRIKMYNKLTDKYYSLSEFEKLIPQIKEKIKKLPSIPLKMTKLKSAEKPPLYKEPIQVKFNDFKNNEQKLRLIKIEDMLLVLMTESIFEKEKLKIETENIKLKNLSLDKSILEKQIKCKLNVCGINIVQNNLKMKNYGDFIRFTKDHRLAGLFKWHNSTEISRYELQKELENYEKVKLEILKIIHEFESKMFLKYETDLISSKNPNNNYFDFELILNTFYSKHPDFSSDFEISKQLRNKFSHNEYPDKSIFTGDLPNSILGISEYLKKITITIFSKYIEILNK